MSELGSESLRPVREPWTLGDEQRLKHLLRVKAYRREHEKIRYFIPNGGQERFLSEVFRPGAFIVIDASGNGGGKTYELVAILAAVCFPKLAPPSLKHPTLSTWSFPKRARIISTHKEVEEVGSIQATIKELFPKGHYRSSRNQKKYDSQINTDTGWVIDIMTYDQDPRDFAGPSIGLTLFNEPPPEPIWKESMARMRKGGMILGAMTSLLDNPWVVDGIFGKADGKDVRVVYHDQEENCKQHGKNGTLDHDILQKILAQYPEDEREARKTGKPLSLSGRVYKSWDRKIHVVPACRPPHEDAQLVMVCDPAIGKPLAVVWAFADALGRITIYREWPDFAFEGSKDNGWGVKEYVDLFRAEEKDRPCLRIMDRHFGGVRRTVGGKSLLQEFSDYNFDFEESYHVTSDKPEVETGILKVKDYLSYDKSKPLDVLNSPKLLVSEECVNTIAAFERWGRNPETGQPKEEYKDFADCVRYLVMAEPKFEESTRLPRNRRYYGVNAS